MPPSPGGSSTRTNRAPRAWAALEEWQRQLRFEFTDSALRVKTERNSSETEWSLHQSWLEAPDAFYVQQRTGAFFIIPKRAFDGEPEVALVRELLRANVRPPTDAPKPPARSMQKTLLLWMLLIPLLGLIYQIMRS